MEYYRSASEDDVSDDADADEYDSYSSSDEAIAEPHEQDIPQQQQQQQQQQPINITGMYQWFEGFKKTSKENRGGWWILPT